ncbi:MAG: hypothetical protein EOM12_07475 [Verrucomicrobiae bacterium]|nr:hypothetical protein [Verrucomicrobiae bacterium]
MYSNLFSRGFFISSNPLEPPIPEIKDWRLLEAGDFLFGFQEKCNVTITEAMPGAEKNNSLYHIFIGYPTDIDNHDYSPDKIGEKALYVYNCEGFDGYEKYIAYLGGRFLSVVVDTGLSRMTIHPDCHATYACYYSFSEDNVVFASHVNLLREMLNLEDDDIATSIIKSENYKSPGGKYYPGLLTPYKSASLLFPNCRIEFDKESKALTHKRFYPFMRNGKVVGNKKNKENFPHYLDANIKSIVKDKEFYISLTSGLDSRVTFLASLKTSALDKIRSFTYFRGEKSSEEQVKDLVTASELSFARKIPHKAVLIKSVDYSSGFHKFYAKSFKRCARFPSLARAYYEELPHDILSLVSTCSETGMAFYKKRDVNDISPSLLARLYTPSSVNKDPAVIKCFEDYIEATEFNNSRLGWLDPYDAFYWEHRNAKWASLWYSEADLAHFTVVPYNQRDIIESMLAAPFNERKEKKLLLDYLESQAVSY